ncbi:MAG: hypothetical protein Kow0070_04350 [Anaerolineales bacterium]
MRLLKKAMTKRQPLQGLFCLGWQRDTGGMQMMPEQRRHAMKFGLRREDMPGVETFDVTG